MIIHTVTAVFLLAGVVTICSQRREISRLRDVKPQTDTLVKTVTIKSSAPAPTHVYLDSPVLMPIWETNTVIRHDTTYVVLDRTVKEYRKENYYARVSGIDPSLDYIETYNTTRDIVTYVQTPVTPKPNFMEISGGFMYDSQVMLPVVLRYGYRKGVFEGSAGGGYDFLTRSPVFDAKLALRFNW